MNNQIDIVLVIVVGLVLVVLLELLQLMWLLLSLPHRRSFCTVFFETKKVKPEE